MNSKKQDAHIFHCILTYLKQFFLHNETNTHLLQYEKRDYDFINWPIWFMHPSPKGHKQQGSSESEYVLFDIVLSLIEIQCHSSFFLGLCCWLKKQTNKQKKSILKVSFGALGVIVMTFLNFFLTLVTQQSICCQKRSHFHNLTQL